VTTEAPDWWFDNVRLVDGDGNVDSSWRVDPANPAREKWSWDLLDEYTAAEPEVGWHLETRGTIAPWHDWERPAERITA
jgi:hypothetical protein